MSSSFVCWIFNKSHLFLYFRQQLNLLYSCGRDILPGLLEGWLEHFRHIRRCVFCIICLANQEPPIENLSCDWCMNGAPSSQSLATLDLPRPYKCKCHFNHIAASSILIKNIFLVDVIQTDVTFVASCLIWFRPVAIFRDSPVYFVWG